MSDQPFTVVVEEKHGEARRSRHRLTLFRPGKLIKAGNDYGVITEHECAPFADCILIAAPLERREISADRIGPRGHNGTRGAENNRVRSTIFTTASGSLEL
jgi:hypothetical protein